MDAWLLSLPWAILTDICHGASLGPEILSLSKQKLWRKVWRTILKRNLTSRMEHKRIEAMGGLLALDGAHLALPHVEERFEKDRRQHVKARAVRHLTTIALGFWRAGQDREATRVLRLVASQGSSRQMNVRAAIATACRVLSDEGYEKEVKEAFRDLVPPAKLQQWMLPEFDLIRLMRPWTFPQGQPEERMRHFSVIHEESAASLHVKNFDQKPVRLAAFCSDSAAANEDDRRDEGVPLRTPITLLPGESIRWAYFSHDCEVAGDDAYYLTSATPDSSAPGCALGQFMLKGSGAIDLEARRPYRSGFLVERWRLRLSGGTLTLRMNKKTFSDEDRTVWLPPSSPPDQRERDEPPHREWVGILENEFLACRKKAAGIASTGYAKKKLRFLGDRHSSISPFMRGNPVATVTPAEVSLPPPRTVPKPSSTLVRVAPGASQPRETSLLLRRRLFEEDDELIRDLHASMLRSRRRRLEAPGRDAAAQDGTRPTWTYTASFNRRSLRRLRDSEDFADPMFLSTLTTNSPRIDATAPRSFHPRPHPPPPPQSGRGFLV